MSEKTTPRPVSKSGVPITDELAEQVANEAEEGYELTQGTLVHIGGGRPSLSGKHPSPQVTFRLPTNLRIKAEQTAARKGKPVSGLAREALEHYLAS